MPRRKPAPLIQLAPDEGADRLATGQRVWLDLVGAALFFGLAPEALLPALQSGELVAMRKPGKRGKDMKNFVIASDTFMAWVTRCGFEAIGFAPFAHDEASTRH